ncbi:MAG: PAS domain-containing protein [Oscillibacter sp.]|nr:PAS domain-containing protein [Oscillibacter sp.]
MKAIKTVYDESPIPFYIVRVFAGKNGEGGEFSFEYMNPALERLGWTAPAPLPGQPIQAAEKAAGAKWLSLYAETAAGGRTQTFVEYGPQIKKYIRIMCYRIAPGYCGCLLTDISAEKKLEDSLNLEQEYRENLLNAIPSGLAVYRTNAGGETESIFLNDELCQITGYSREELLRAGSMAVCRPVPEDVSGVQQAVRGAAAAGRRASAVYRTRTKSGAVKYIQLSASSAVVDGTIQYTHVIYTDITEQERQSRIAELHREELRQISSAVPGGIFRCKGSPGWPVAYANDSFYRFIGYSEAEFARRFQSRIGNLIHPDDRPELIASSREQLAAGKAVRLRSRVMCGDGETRWMDLQGRQFPDENGEESLYCVLIDISEQADLEKQLALYRTSKQSGVFTVAVDEGFTHLYGNDKFYSMLEYTRESMAERLHNRSIEYVHPRDRDLTAQTVNAALEQGKTYLEWEMRIVTGTGKLRYVICNGMLEKTAGRQIMNGVIMDITEQKLAEEALRVSEEKFRIATENSDVSFWTYYFDSREIVNTPASLKRHGKGAVVHGVPDSLIASGYVRADSAAAFAEMYQKLRGGAKTASGDFWFRRDGGDGWWCEHIDYTAASDEAGRPARAYAVGRDITEEIQQRIERKKLEIALENSNLYVWEHDIIGKKTFHQENAMRDFAMGHVLENAPEFVIQRGIIHPDSAEAYRELHRAVRRGEKSAQADICYIKADGTPSWRHCTYTTIFMDGKPVSAIGCAVDISKAKAMEHRFHEEEAYSNAVQGENLIAKARSNITRNLVESYTAKKGYGSVQDGSSYEAAAEAMAASGFAEADRARIRSYVGRDRVLRAFAEDDRTYSIDYRRRASDGSVIWVNTTVKSYQNPETGDVMSFMYTYNIDSDKIKEGIIQAVTTLEYDFIAYIDLKTERFRLYTGAEHAQTLLPTKAVNYTQSVYEVNRAVVIPEDAERAISDMLPEGIRKHLKEQRVFSTVYSVYDEHRNIRQKRLQYAYLDEANGQVVCTRTDVTSLLEKQKLQQDTLEAALLAAKQANSAKSDFLSRMSHEIRTPMNAIIGMSAIAAQSVGNDAEVADCIGKIGISSRFLLSLINDILDMSRIESGKMLLKNEKIPFEEFLNGINSICYAQAREKNIDYENLVDPSVEGCYIGDAMKLQQVVINILSNAVKFTPEGGKVCFSVRELKKNKHCATLRFVINDTGCGISEEFIPCLFDPFSQENTGTTAIYGGTGLGLAICKNLVDMMDGHIGVRSIVGAGTEFTVDVKLGITEESRIRYLHKPHYNFTQMKALVVDDDITVCEQAVITLKEIGVTGEWVDSGRKAVDQVREKWERKAFYDFVLVDWKMPDMDGIETARRIRKIVGPDVTIIIMTAYDWASIEHEAKLAGVNLLMSKPMFKSNLISAFEKALGCQTEKDTEISRDFRFDGKRILLAEDHPLNVEVAVKLLEAKGFAVDHAENGLRALEMFTTAPVGYYDAILMDIRMPDMDGLQASYSIRRWRREDAKTVPIIAMTANAFEEDVQKSRAAGMNAHLAKPIDPQQMYQTLYDFICGQPAQ